VRGDAAHYNHAMLALRYVYVLALVVWLGGMLILGAVVAPTVFEVLQEHGVRRVASSPARCSARRWPVPLRRVRAGGILLLTLGAMRVLGPRPARSGLRAVIVASMLGVALYSGLVVLRQIDAVQEAAGGLPSRLPAGDERRARFDALHVLSTRLMMLNIAGALVLLYWEARE